MPTVGPLRPIPARSVRPWAGTRLAGPDERVGELWLAGPDSLVDTADGGRATLDELAAATGESFVGHRSIRLLGPRFPLLVKLIDAAEWLSLQVHPSDMLAARLRGPGTLGKAEAWLVLDAAPGAELVTGPRPGLGGPELRRAIAAGALGREHCEARPCRPGEALFLAPGTLHAIGPGCFVYEIEQPSDLTFRMSDWGRPATADRPLHIEESLAALDPGAHVEERGRGWRLDGGALTVREFRLELVGDGSTTRRPSGESLEVVTAIRGRVEAAGDGWHEMLEPYATLVVPASVPEYRIAGSEDALVCVGSVP